MITRERIYERITELKKDVADLEYEKFHTDVNCPSKNFFFERRIDQLNWMINQRCVEIDKLKYLLSKDVNEKTLSLTSIYEESLDFEKIAREGIRGVSL